MTRREWIGGGLVLGALLAAAIWAMFILPGNGDAASPAPITPFTPTETTAPSPEPTTPSPTATDTPTPTATPTERFTPTELPTGEDFEQVVQTIFDIRHQAFTRPDAAVLGQIYANQCECSTQEQEAIRALAGNGERVGGPPPVVSDVEITERSDTDAAVLVFRVTVVDAVRIDSQSGETVRRFEDDSYRLEAALLRGFGTFDDGRWLVAGLRPIREESP